MSEEEKPDGFQIAKEKARRARKEPPAARSGICKVCQGSLTETFFREFDATTGALIIGPGAGFQFHWKSHGLHCSSCGLKYQFPPTQP